MERGAISHAVNYRITNKAAPFVSLCSVKLLFFFVDYVQTYLFVTFAGFSTGCVKKEILREESWKLCLGV